MIIHDVEFGRLGFIITMSEPKGFLAYVMSRPRVYRGMTYWSLPFPTPNNKMPKNQRMQSKNKGDLFTQTQK